jgi:hypothetical protein
MSTHGPKVKESEMNHDQEIIKRMREIVAKAFAEGRATWDETMKTQILIDTLETKDNPNAQDQTHQK